MATGSGRLWGGRFAGAPADAMMALSRSVEFDWRLAQYDLAQSRAHSRALRAAGILTDGELGQLIDAIDALSAEVAAGDAAPAPADEDVHAALERMLIERVGDLGGKLRAGRSRNDQIAGDLRLYSRDAARAIANGIVELGEALLHQAEDHVDAPAPGYTHLQRAQPVSFGHELAKHVQALLRDLARLRDWDERAAVSPFGAGALSGSPLGLDTATIAAELGFATVAANSIDAVSDRDFAAEFLFVSALLGVHLSRLGEEICLWTSKEFGFAKLDDSWSTGSSIMPQKKNPDVAELARGKAGRLIGDLTGLLATLKGLPFAYNRDLQEDKEPLFDATDTLLALLPALTGLVETLRFDKDRMASVAVDGHALATEVADWLVGRGVAFSESHDIAGRCVVAADSAGCQLWELSDEQLASVSPSLEPQVREVLNVAAALESRSTPGGTAAAEVAAQLRAARADLELAREWAQRPARAVR